MRPIRGGGGVWSRVTENKMFQKWATENKNARFSVRYYDTFCVHVCMSYMYL